MVSPITSTKTYHHGNLATEIICIIACPYPKKEKRQGIVFLNLTMDFQKTILLFCGSYRFFLLYITVVFEITFFFSDILFVLWIIQWNLKYIFGESSRAKQNYPVFQDTRNNKVTPVPFNNAYGFNHVV